MTCRPRGGQCFPWCLRVGRTRHRGTHLPSALRAFLLTLAAIEDLIAIVIIAVVCTSAPGLLNRTTDESMEGSIMGKRIVVLVISVCRCYWALDSRQRFRTTRIGIGVLVLGSIIVAGGVVLLVVGIRMQSRPGPRVAAADANVSGLAVAGDRPSLTSAWVPVRRCRS